MAKDEKVYKPELAISRNADNNDLVVRDEYDETIMANFSIDATPYYTRYMRFYFAHLFANAETMIDSLKSLLPLAKKEAAHLADEDKPEEAGRAYDKIDFVEALLKKLEGIQGAIEHLEKVAVGSPGTVIDSGWEECLNEEENKETLQALLLITGKANYEKVLERFEGFTIEELIQG